MKQKFSVGEKVDYITKNNQVQKGNYIVGTIYNKNSMTYQLQDQDGVQFISEEKNISLSGGK